MARPYPLSLPSLMGYTPLNESTTALWFAKARAEQGWNVVSSHGAAGSNVWIDPNREFESKPLLPWFPKFEKTKFPFQKSWRWQRTWGACDTQSTHVQS